MRMLRTLRDRRLQEEPARREAEKARSPIPDLAEAEHLDRCYTRSSRRIERFTNQLERLQAKRRLAMFPDPWEV